MIAQCKWSSNDGNSWRFSLQHSISPYTVISPILGSARIEKIFKLAYLPADIRKWWICWGRRYHQGIAMWFKYFGFFVAFYTLSFISVFLTLFSFYIIFYWSMSLRERSSCPEVLYKKFVLKIFAKFIGKHRSLFCDKVLSLRPATLLKKESGTSVSMNWLKLLTFFLNTPRRLLQEKVFNGSLH